METTRPLLMVDGPSGRSVHAVKCLTDIEISRSRKYVEEYQDVEEAGRRLELHTSSAKSEMEKPYKMNNRTRRGETLRRMATGDPSPRGQRTTCWATPGRGQLEKQGA